MAKITREQAQKWDAQAKGGFHFDVRQYAIWGEKELRRTVELDGGDVLELKLEYTAEHETRTNEYGCRWTVATGRHIPTLRVTRWRPSSSGSGCYVSHGAGKTVAIAPAEKSKKYALLCRLSGELDCSPYIAEAVG
mgnify:CR=1 FL=1